MNFINDKNFKLVGFSVYVEYNDFTRYVKLMLQDDLELVQKTTKEYLLTKSNCDEYYSVEYTPLYEVLNSDYKVLAGFEVGFEEELYSLRELEYFRDNKLVAGKCIDTRISTPKENIPVNEELQYKINGLVPTLVNCNGDTDLETVQEIKNLLERMGEYAMKYQVTYISKDNQKFQYTCSAKSEEQARILTEQKIIENGWDHYQYRFYKISFDLK